MKIYLHRNMIIGFLSSFLLILGLAFTAYFYFNRMTEITRWAAHARRVLYHTEQVRSFSVEIETSQRGYGLTGEELFLKPYRGAVDAVRVHLKELDSLTADNAAQQSRISQLRQLVNNRIKFADEVVQARKESFEKAKGLVLTLNGIKIMEGIKQLLTAIQEEENNLIVIRSISAKKQFFQFVLAFVGLVGSMVVILAALIYIINANLRSRTLAEDRMKRAELELKKVNQELESFTYSVSHDLRAPLRSINGYAQILKEDYSDKIDEEGNQTIEVISRNAKRMGQLIDDLLGFARLGRQDLRKSKINMDDLVQSVLNELMDQQKGREVILNVSPLRASLGDINMIRQVWINLLSNALKYTQKKEVCRIEIGCQDTDTGSETVYFVKDNGAGFNMQYEHKLFGVFQRLHGAQDFEGTGVGLALCKRIVDRHNGNIWAEAKVNEGAVFYFSLPRQRFDPELESK